MSDTSQKRAEEFLKLSPQFRLGALVTESSHPVSATLSQTARDNIQDALRILFDVDDDVLATYRQLVSSGQFEQIKSAVLRALNNGGKLFFTGCGSTGRLSIQLVSIWRDFWQRQRPQGLSSAADQFEPRAVSVMAGGDFALIKAVEGFEDFTDFGKKQLADAGVSFRDVVFAITEGGETSFVIGTAWKALEVGAEVYFIYNNPDTVLCANVERSREVIQEPRINKLNLTTGPMAITGSTRMQATSIQLAALLTVLEMVLRDLLQQLQPDRPLPLSSDEVPTQFLRELTSMQSKLKSPELLAALAKWVQLEEAVYRAGRRNNYFANRVAIDVLTDTTERSPTYCTPPFRKFDDVTATESWAFLFLPCAETPAAWEAVLKRPPVCLDWTEHDIRALVAETQAARTVETMRRITKAELFRFKIGLDGLACRPLGPGDCAVAVLTEPEKDAVLLAGGFYRAQLEAARNSGTRFGVLYLGSEESVAELRSFLAGWAPDSPAVLISLPKTNLLLNGVMRVTLKLVLNALSTCTMVRLGRVMGNYMIWVVPSNLKLIDRATRYIQQLAGLDYIAANHLLFEVIEYVTPRMKNDQAYPPVVGLAVLREKYGITNGEAEDRLMRGNW